MSVYQLIAWQSFPPVIPLLRDRRFSLVILATAGLFLFLFAAGIPFWPCPFLHVTGIPCPGCGLTRAIYFLLKGDVRTSLTYHAFAPIFLLGLTIVASALVLPERPRQRWLDKLVSIEQRSGIIQILLVGLIVYWLARLIFLNSAFVQLIRG
jgi:hypothetical protein